MPSLSLLNYEYITHKLIERPWGVECRYTVKDGAGNLIDNVVSVPSLDIREEDLVNILVERLALITAVQPEQGMGNI